MIIFCFCSFSDNSVCAQNLSKQNIQVNSLKEISKDGLKLSLSVVLDPKRLSKNFELKIIFDNIGKEDRLLNLGIMLANGEKQYPGAIQLIVTNEKGKNFELLLYQLPGVAGRVDPYPVALPSGASYMLKTSFDKLKVFDLSSSEFRKNLPTGKYKIQAKYVANETISNRKQPLIFWSGILQSNVANFEI